MRSILILLAALMAMPVHAHEPQSKTELCTEIIAEVKAAHEKAVTKTDKARALAETGVELLTDSNDLSIGQMSILSHLLSIKEQQMENLLITLAILCDG